MVDRLLEEFFRRNEEFYRTKALSADLSKDLERAKEGQHPKAVVLSCSDSRVVPEYFLKAGIGELFVIRNAGNVLSEEVKESIYYAVEHLHVSHIFIIGHESCGAVTATFKGNQQGIEKTFSYIKPHIEGAESVEEAVKMHARKTADEVANLPFVRDKKVAVVPLFYFLDGRLEPI